MTVNSDKYNWDEQFPSLYSLIEFANRPCELIMVETLELDLIFNKRGGGNEIRLSST